MTSKEQKRFLKKIEASAVEIEERLNVKKDFIRSLIAEDPWSFIIKTHTIVEAAVSNAVSASINKPNLDDWVASLPLNGKASKMSLLRNFVELKSVDIQFVQALSNLRNQLVHKIENVEFDYQTYFESLEQNKRTQLLKGLSYAFSTSPEGDPDLRPIKDDPQNTIWHGTRIFLAFLNLHSKIMESEAETIRHKLRIADAFSQRKK